MISLIALYKDSRAGGFILRMVLTLSVLFPVMAGAQVTITTTALPVGNTSNTYYATLAATGGTAPYTWQLIGSLPTGLNISSAGAISGLATQVTTGTPPLPTAFTVQVTDSLSASATQSLSITILPPGSHSLVLTQIFSGGNAGSLASPSPYQSDYVEIFNAGPMAVDLQNWTLQFGSSGSAFAASGVAPIGSLDPYKIGSTGGPNNDGNFPAFAITYSSAFIASNCNPASTTAQVNALFPPSHCWLNPGQYMLVLTAGNAAGANTGVKPIPLLPADLDLGATAANGNSGPASSTSASNTGYVGHSGSPLKPGSSGGMVALVNGVGIGVTCRSGTPGNPLPPAAFSPTTSDFLAYFAQNTAGNIALNTCWNGSSFPVGGTGTTYATTTMGGAIHVSSSGKNYNALIRSAGNGKLNSSPVQNSLTYPAGKILAASGVTLTPCGDTGNNLSDFAPITNGMNLGSVKGQANWVLHNSSAYTNPTIEASYASTPLPPLAYTPTACLSLNTLGPIVAAEVNPSVVPEGSTATLTVTVTPSSAPVSELFNVSAPVSGISGAAMIGNSISSSSIGVPDGFGNLQYTEQFTVQGAIGPFEIPVTVVDDAYRYAGTGNANGQSSLNAGFTVISACVAPTVIGQAVSMSWNTSQPITLSGALAANCSAGDSLVYAIQSGPANGSLSILSGNSITYTPNNNFSGMDSFTFNVNVNSGAGGDAPLPGKTSLTATVTITVNGTGVPVLTLNCPGNLTYNGLAESCTASLSPFVAGTTTITYNGSATAPTAAGSYPVNASFVATSDASQNTSASSTLLIGLATPTLNVTCGAVSWTGSPEGCTAIAKGVGGATVNGTFSFTYQGNLTPPTDAGTYAVVASFTSNDPNYANTTTSSSLTIYEPLVTITVNNQTMTYGGTLPSLTYTVTPSVPLQTAPTCVSTANGVSSVGTYTGAITCSGATKIGCTFTYVAGNMTVQAASATVAANNQTMVSGATVPTLTYVTIPSSLAFTTAPACTTTATSASPIGTYPITCVGGVAPNYSLSYTGGTMTVTIASTIPNGIPTISGVTPMSVTAGSPSLALTVNGSGFVSGATVLLNGSVRATMYVSSRQLTATILASDMVSVGSAEVTVFNPAPGGGTSAVQTFSIDSVPQAQGSFTVSPASSALTVTHGQSVSSSVTFSTLQPGAVVSAVCYNLPAFGSCSFNGTLLTIVTGANSQPGIYNVLVVFSTSGTLTSRNNSSGVTVLCGLFGFPLGLVILLRGRRLRFYSLGAMSVLLLMVAIGCGGNTVSQKTPVVSAQSSAVVTLTVQ
jgi:hypothetical protein